MPSMVIAVLEAPSSVITGGVKSGRPAESVALLVICITYNASCEQSCP
jgi:hypothetical protein